jgi:hypothetical protein
MATRRGKRRSAGPASEERSARARSGPARAGPRKGTSGAPGLPMPPCLLEASPEPAIVDVPSRTAVAIDGAGPPDDPSFGRSVGALYGAAYGLKFSRKASGATFKIGPLEGRWWAEGAPDATLQAPRESWRWRLRIAVPDRVSEAELARVIEAAASRKGGKLEGSAEVRKVWLERIPPSRLGRILHVGPYADEPRSFARLDSAIADAGLRPARSHVEIYLSDPRRTAPARLRTVLLRELVA